MHRYHPSSTQEKRASNLTAREQELRFGVAAAELRAALAEHRAAMLKLYLAGDPKLQKILADIFQEVTDDKLVKHATKS